MTDLEDTAQKFKFIFLGDQSVGKSCILNRYVNDRFEEEYQATIGLDFQSKTILINGTEVRILLYDTAGQEKFRSLIPMYIRQADVVLIVYDITREDSFESLEKWYRDVIDIRGNDAIYVLIGNKIDLADERKITFEQGKKFADEKGISFSEISTKTGEGFEFLFDVTVIDLLKQKFYPISEGPSPIQKKGITIEYESQEPPSDKLSDSVVYTKKKKKKCC